MAVWRKHIPVNVTLNRLEQHDNNNLIDNTTHLWWVHVVGDWGDWILHRPLGTSFEARGKLRGSFPSPPPDGVLYSLHWQGCKSLLTAWESAAVEYWVCWCLVNPGRTYSYLGISRPCNIEGMFLFSVPSLHVDLRPLFPSQLLALQGIAASMPRILFQGLGFLGLKCLKSGLHH